MKFTFIFILFLLLTHQAFSKTLIISDIDDTIKVTNVLSKTDSVINGIFSKKAFSGMSELYQVLNKDNNIIYYVSGAPAILKEVVGGFLEFNNFPQSNKLILKNDSLSTYEYKVMNIRNLILKLKPDNIILIGDDTQFDPEVYQTIFEENPTVVKSIYIRAIKNRKIPNNDLMKNFFSSVEITGFEMLNGTLTSENLAKVSMAFIKQALNSQVFIPGRYCPANGRMEIDELKQKVREQTSIDFLELTQQTIIATCQK